MRRQERQYAGMMGVVVALGVLVAAQARAADWAKALFSELGHDFGPVARGAIVRHPFVVTNRLNEPITILNVRASCGCTTGHTNAQTVHPGQSAVIEAQMDTRNFVGYKPTTLFVHLVTASGREAEVRLAVASTILSDIVLNPGTLDFGAVTRGESPSQTLTIDRLGAPNWKVVRMVSASKVLNASIVETGRSGDTVQYTLTASLKPDAPAGLVRDEIHILTNDPESPRIPVLVTAQIRGVVTASPSVLALGQVTSADGAQGRIVVRGAQPFAILRVEGEGDGFHVGPIATEPKPIHLVPIAFRPEESALRGDIRRTFRIITDVPGEPALEVSVTAHVAP